MEVWYLLIEGWSPARSVLISPGSTVSTLTAKIMCANPTCFDGVDELQVQIYLAKLPNGNWPTDDMAETQALMHGDTTVVKALCTKRLHANDSIEQQLRSSTNQDIHVLVQVVEAPAPLQAEQEKFELQCLILGDARPCLMHLRVGKTSSVHELKEEIKLQFPDPFLGKSAAAISLYIARTERDGWLEDSSPDVDALSKRQESALAVWLSKKMDSLETLNSIFSAVGDLPQDKIHVVVEQSAEFVVSENQESWIHTDAYWKVADRLAKTPEVDQLLRDIKRLQQDPGNVPFVVLASSTGTGKTQMAFNLMARQEVEVFYVVCGEVREDVHNAFARRSDAFQRCVAKDLPTMHDAQISSITAQPQCYTYGFIWALLTGRPAFVQQRTRTDVSNALAGRTCVFFLDNFPCLEGSKREPNKWKPRFMINVFRSFGITVILSATNEVVWDLVTLGIRERSSMWCLISPSLPRFQDPRVEDLESEALREIIKHSRPSFAKVALEYVLESPLDASTGFVEYMDRMVGVLAHAFTGDYSFSSEYFLMGQLCLFFAASFVREGSGIQETTPGLIRYHFARIMESSSFELWFSPSGLPVKGMHGPDPWQCCSVFPTFEQDALLHLCLTGGKYFAALRDLESKPISICQAIHFVESRPGAGSKHLYRSSSSSQATNDRTRLEALVIGAVVAASHRDGFGGMRFPKFLSALLYELGMQWSPDVPVSFPEDAKDLVNSVAVPFLTQPGVDLPEFISMTQLRLEVATQRRAKNRAVVSLGKHLTMECLTVETDHKTLTTDVLASLVRSIPVTSVIHLTFVKLVPPKQDQTRETYDEMIAGKSGEGSVSDPALAKVRRRKKPADRIAKEKTSKQGKTDNKQRGGLAGEHASTKGRRRRKKHNKKAGENQASKQGHTKKQHDTFTVETKAPTKAHGPESHGDIAAEMRTTCFRLVKVTTGRDAPTIESISTSEILTSAGAEQMAIAMEL